MRIYLFMGVAFIIVEQYMYVPKLMTDSFEKQPKYWDVHKNLESRQIDYRPVKIVSRQRKWGSCRDEQNTLRVYSYVFPLTTRASKNSVCQGKLRHHKWPYTLLYILPRTSRHTKPERLCVRCISTVNYASCVLRGGGQLSQTNTRQCPTQGLISCVWL